MSDTDRAAQIGRKIAHQYGHVTMGPELETELSGDIAAALRSYGLPWARIEAIGNEFFDVPPEMDSDALGFDAGWETGVRCLFGALKTAYLSQSKSKPESKEPQP